MDRFWDNVCCLSWLSIMTTIITVMECTLIICYWRIINMGIMKFLATVLMFLVALVLILLLLDGVCIVPNAKSAFKEGLSNSSIPCYVPRNNLVQQIKLKLRRPSINGSPYLGGYALIGGQPGCGKMTIIQQAVIETGPGILYISVGANGDVLGSPYRALRIEAYCSSYWIKLQSYLNMTTSVCSGNSVEYALEILSKAAKEIFGEEGYTPAVVLDNLSYVLKQNLFDGAKLLGILQDTTKQFIDEKAVIVMFASSESSVANFMRTRSSTSLLTYNLKIGDITDEQARNYLSCMCPKAMKEEVDTAVELVGGHFVDLITAAEFLQNRGTDENMTLEQRLLQT